jgi:hypothetical protein
VDDSEIKEGDWYLIGRTIYHCIKNIPEDLHNENKIFKITHSTQLLGVKPITNKVVIEEDKDGKPLMSAQYVELDMSSTVKRLPLQEVRELIGEYDPKLIDSMALRYRHDFGLLEENEKESIRTTMKQLWEEVVGNGFYKNDKKSEQKQIEIEWEVEIVDGKLKLKL